MTAIEKNELSLQHMSQEMRGNRDFIMEAIQRNGGALEHASEAMRNDDDVCGAAVAQNPFLLQYTSSRFQAEYAAKLKARSADYAFNECKKQEESSASPEENSAKRIKLEHSTEASGQFEEQSSDEVEYPAKRVKIDSGDSYTEQYGLALVGDPSSAPDQMDDLS